MFKKMLIINNEQELYGYINIDDILMIIPHEKGSEIVLTGDTYVIVKHTPDEIYNLANYVNTDIGSLLQELQKSNEKVQG